MSTPLTALTTPISPAARGWLGFAQPLETRVREPLSALLADVGVVERIFTPPTAWLDTRTRWQEYLETSTPNVDRLAAYLASGTGDVTGLRACALAEMGAGSVAEADLTSVLAGAVHAALNALWAPVAMQAFKACAATFDSAVVVDDDAELDAAADALVAAARLLGADANCATWATQRLTLAMCVDVARGHPRHIATQFSVRPDRWQAVCELGGQLRAAEGPRTEYPQLPAYQVCVDQHRSIQRWDPLDGPLPKGWQHTVDGWIGS